MKVNFLRTLLLLILFSAQTLASSGERSYQFPKGLGEIQFSTLERLLTKNYPFYKNLYFLSGGPQNEAWEYPDSVRITNFRRSWNLWMILNSYRYKYIFDAETLNGSSSHQFSCEMSIKFHVISSNDAYVTVRCPTAIVTTALNFSFSDLRREQ